MAKSDKKAVKVDKKVEKADKKAKSADSKPKAEKPAKATTPNKPLSTKEILSKVVSVALFFLIDHDSQLPLEWR